MSLISDIHEARKLEQARSQPRLNFLAFSPSQLLAEIQADLFPDVCHRVRVDFVTEGPLACISHCDDRASIYIHQLLNHLDTPVEVIQLILKHELLHLRIPPTCDAGKTVFHPPEFWAAERAIAPEHDSAWAWIWVNFALCLKRLPKQERIQVRSHWKKTWSLPRTDLATCRQMARLSTQPAEELGGW